MNDPADHRLNRRTFLARSAAALAATSVVGFPMIGRGQAVPAPLKLALVGCGGRGAGAANQALTADDYTKLVAVADLFPDKLAVGLKSLQAAHSKSPSRWMPVASRRAQRHFPHRPPQEVALRAFSAGDWKSPLLGRPPVHPVPKITPACSVPQDDFFDVALRASALLPTCLDEFRDSL